ncbi:ABC transporter substrate-binding protein [Bacillus sp. CLL-7-23]|uniref:ABC transporter substrate-binding protein n=1 Tax=Bacillus changyiensis TaxID=3004103 RepID=A0ABT4X361_9BACI|nr:ABC transporter substrate-binding protein [Bacillus changyiensis]MDA7026618.1 ABC transporter substrate-binding protein [Bacillus changyiensis]
MKERHWLKSLSMLLFIAIFLIGCSGKDEESKRERDTLIFGRGGDSTSLDPITATEGEAFKVTINLFETLLNYGEQDTTLKKGLAVKWDASDDGLTYTLKLRKGVKFHDGTDFNAEAVKYNFERWMNGDEEKFPYYGMFGGYKKDKGHVIKQIKVLDDHKIQFVLKRPQAPFLKNLAMTAFGIASPAALKKYGETFRKHPVGTGPYQFVQWKANDRIVIKKNENYWDREKPKLKRIIFRVIPENSARLNALKTGEIDLMDGVNPADIERIKEDKQLKISKRPSMNVGYLGLTTNRKPFDNKLVRQALNHAVDKQAIIDSFYGGLAEPAKNPLPPSLEGYHDKIKPYPYDLEKAKQLLKKAGYPNGFKMKLWAMPVPRPYMPDGMKIAEVIQSSFEKIGVQAQIVTYDWATYLDKVSKGEADSFLMGWTGDNGDPDNFIYTLLDKDNIGGNNYTYFSHDELHDILIKAQTIPDQKKRNELYQKAQELVHDESPWIPLAHSTPILAGASHIKGYVPHPTGNEVLSSVEFQ